MPTNLISSTGAFYQEDVILATEMGLRSPRALTVDPTKIQADANGQRIVRPGVVLYKIPGATLHRVGLRTKTASAVVASSTTVITLAQMGAQYQTPTAQFLAPGDVLKVLRPYGTITLAGAWAAGDTLTATIEGQSVTYTALSGDVAGDTTADKVALAVKLAAAINASPILSKLVEAVASGPVVYVFGKGLAPLTLAASESTAGDGTATASGTVLAGNVTLGTIDAGGVSYANGTITLAAAAAVSLPIGAPIGVEGLPWGLVVSAYDAGNADNDVTGYIAATVYGDRLPYWDQDIQNELPEIKFFV